MRKSLLLLALGLAVALTAPAMAQPSDGDPAPDISMTKTWNNPGSKSKLSDFKGEYVHLIFWATG